MKYEEWLEILEELKQSSDIEKIEKLKKEPINSNINDLLQPKIESLIIERFRNSVNKIINQLDNILSDPNMLDLSLISFKKEIILTKELANLKQLSSESKNELNDMLKDETNKVFDILIKESHNIDYTGSTERIINNSRINWSE